VDQNLPQELLNLEMYLRLGFFKMLSVPAISSVTKVMIHCMVAGTERKEFCSGFSIFSEYTVLAVVPITGHNQIIFKHHFFLFFK
jgi:hypothetical protein